MLVRKSIEIQIFKRNKFYEYCKSICNKSRILHDELTYIKRQNFFNKDLDNKLISNKELYETLKKSENFKIFGHSQLSKSVYRDILEEWNSFYKSLASYKKNPNEFKSKPKPPGYCKWKSNNKDKYKISFHVGQNNSPCTFKNGIFRFLGIIKFDYKFNKKVDGVIKEISITPKSNGFVVSLNYVAEIKTEHLNYSNIASIDYGVNNLVTLTNNLGKQPIIINGRPLKSMNQFYNKKLAKFQSNLKEEIYTSNRIKILTRKRNNKIKNECHKITNLLVNYIKQNNIGSLVIGNNKEWKQNINIGKKNNQKFVSIPYSIITNQLKYKLEGLCDIILQEESYTSKASFLDLDEIPIFKKDHKQNHKFSGKRIKRGLYKSKMGKLINADVNGSFNIMRKVFPNVFKDNGIEGVIVHPLQLVA